MTFETLPSRNRVLGVTGTDRSSGFTLLNNQRFLGAGASQTLAAITGLTVQPYSTALPATGGANPTVTSGGVTVTLSGDQTGTTTTDGSGNFSFAGLAAGGSYLITPTLAGYNFDPINRSYSNLLADVTNADFIAYPGNSPRVVKAASQNVLPGDPAIVPITIDSLGDENSLGFSVTYDPAVLSSPVISLGADCADCSVIQNISSGQIGVIVSKPSLPTPLTFAAGTRQVIVITFSTTGTPPAYPGSSLTFGDTPVTREVSNANADPLFATYSGGAVTFTVGYESDVAPRFGGSNTGVISVADYTQTGRFAAGLDTVNPLFNELQRADSAPRSTRGNGSISVSDYTQAGRYAAGLDPATTVGGAAFLFRTGGADGKIFNPNASLLPRIISASDESTSPGQQVTVSILVAAEGDENGFGFTVTYDGTKLGNPLVLTGTDLPSAVPFVNTATPGRVGIITSAGFGATIPAGTREIARIRFDVSPTAGTGPTSITFAGFPPVENEVSDVFANVLPTMYTEGTVTILEPTAASTSVGGIVTTADGIAVNRARVTMTDGTGASRTVVSNAFGLYRFDDVPVGGTYVISVRAKGRNFAPVAVTVAEEVTGLRIVADP